MGRTCSLEPEEFLHELGSDEGIRVFTQAWVQLVARRDDVAHALDAHELDRRAGCLLYTSPSPRDGLLSRMPSSA